ncbi:DUF6138 family protein [Aneurinibacillus migulanus]|uniref:DUF6138 family protein n=1 Tax=Aneurinibacillus migulanus TaxID=47500 RepID=UPI002E2184BA|nr:DUF6138 family protein [Aneurinibacillus migulanus]
MSNAKGRVSVTDIEQDFISPKVKIKHSEPTELLSEEQVREQVAPELALFMQRKLNSLQFSTLIDYMFTFSGKFQVQEGEVNMSMRRRRKNFWNESPIILKRSSNRESILFICRLLKQGFPHSYQIKLKSSAKQFLPIKRIIWKRSTRSTSFSVIHKKSALSFLY